MGVDIEEFIGAYQKEKEERAKTKVQARKEKSVTNSKASQSHALLKRPAHVILFWFLVAIFAYVLLAIGWIIGAIGDAIWEIGCRLHESKWNIT